MSLSSKWANQSTQAKLYDHPQGEKKDLVIQRQLLTKVSGSCTYVMIFFAVLQYLSPDEEEEKG